MKDLNKMGDFELTIRAVIWYIVFWLSFLAPFIVKAWLEPIR